MINNQDELLKPHETLEIKTVVYTTKAVVKVQLHFLSDVIFIATSKSLTYITVVVNRNRSGYISSNLSTAVQICNVSFTPFLSMNHLHYCKTEVTLVTRK